MRRGTEGSSKAKLTQKQIDAKVLFEKAMVQFPPELPTQGDYWVLQEANRLERARSWRDTKRLEKARLMSYPQHGFHLLKLANKSDKTNLDVHFQLAECYRLGRGVEKSVTKAQRHYEKLFASDHGLSEAAKKAYFQMELPDAAALTADNWYALAQQFHGGLDGKPKHPIKAFVAASLAIGCDPQHAGASVMIGDVYHLGRVCDRNIERAKEYYQIAADAGIARAVRAMLIIDMPKGVKVPKTARQWNKSGCYFSKGTHAYTQNSENAVKCYRTALELDRTAGYAHVNYARHLISGEACERDIVQARHHLNLAAAHGYKSRTMKYLIEIDLLEKNEKMPETALQWCNLANSYKGRGNPLQHDEPKARCCYQQAIKVDDTNAEAHFNLALHYLHGIACEENPDKARRHFRSARSNGSVVADEQLFKMNFPSEAVMPTSAEDWLEFGLKHAKQKSLGMSHRLVKQCFEEALRLDPKNGRANYLLGSHYYKVYLDDEYAKSMWGHDLSALRQAKKYLKKSVSLSYGGAALRLINIDLSYTANVLGRHTPVCAAGWVGLGNEYARGSMDLAINYQKANACYCKAIKMDAGCVDARYRLAENLRRGRGCSAEHPNKANEHYIAAAQMSHSNSFLALVRAHLEEGAELPSTSGQWFDLAARFHAAQLPSRHRYEIAKLCYQQSLALNNENARTHFNLAQLYRTGVGSIDLGLARQHYEKAAVLGSKEALEKLILLDLPEGRAYPQTADEWVEMGKDYSHGFETVDQNCARSTYCYAQALTLEVGHPIANLNMADHLVRGRASDKDVDLARRHYEIADKAGIKAAKLGLLKLSILNGAQGSSARTWNTLGFKYMLGIKGMDHSLETAVLCYQQSLKFAINENSAFIASVANANMSVAYRHLPGHEDKVLLHTQAFLALEVGINCASLIGIIRKDDFKYPLKKSYHQELLENIVSFYLSEEGRPMLDNLLDVASRTYSASALWEVTQKLMAVCSSPKLDKSELLNRIASKVVSLSGEHNSVKYLHLAVRAGFPKEAIQQIIRQTNVDLAWPGAGGISLAMIACHKGDVETLRSVLRYPKLVKSSANSVSDGGATALYYAVGSGKPALVLQLVQSLVEFNCNSAINKGNYYNKTPLHKACERAIQAKSHKRRADAMAIMNILLNHGANADIVSADRDGVAGQSVRQMAEASGCAELIKSISQVRPVPEAMRGLSQKAQRVRTLKHRILALLETYRAKSRTLNSEEGRVAFDQTADEIHAINGENITEFDRPLSALRGKLSSTRESLMPGGLVHAIKDLNVGLMVGERTTGLRVMPKKAVAKVKRVGKKLARKIGGWFTRRPRREEAVNSAEVLKAAMAECQRDPAVLKVQEQEARQDNGAAAAAVVSVGNAPVVLEQAQVWVDDELTTPMATFHAHHSTPRISVACFGPAGYGSGSLFHTTGQPSTVVCLPRGELQTAECIVVAQAEPQSHDVPGPIVDAAAIRSESSSSDISLPEGRAIALEKLNGHARQLNQSLKALKAAATPAELKRTVNEWLLYLRDSRVAVGRDCAAVASRSPSSILLEDMRREAIDALNKHHAYVETTIDHIINAPSVEYLRENAAAWGRYLNTVEDSFSAMSDKRCVVFRARVAAPVSAAALAASMPIVNATRIDEGRIVAVVGEVVEPVVTGGRVPVLS